MFQTIETFENIQVIREQMEFAIRERQMSLKMIARLLKGKTIGDLLALADSIEVTANLQEIVAILN
jgi:hypothetical protein